jgi:hypothetical protein
MEYKAETRDVAGHFCDAANCRFFMHTDIVPVGKDAYKKAAYCISLIGEYWPNHKDLNISGKRYELAVFDKMSDRPWSEIDGDRIDDKQEAISAFNALVEKWLAVASAASPINS